APEATVMFASIHRITANAAARPCKFLTLPVKLPARPVKFLAFAGRLLPPCGCLRALTRRLLLIAYPCLNPGFGPEPPVGYRQPCGWVSQAHAPVQLFLPIVCRHRPGPAGL